MNSSQVDQFVSFICRLCGYIVSTAPEVYVCHVFQCAPNAAPLTKALAEACQVRLHDHDEKYLVMIHRLV